MSKRQRSTRRTVLQTLGALGTLGIATPAAAGVTAATTDARADTDRYQRTSPTATAGEWDDATLYVAVVDRIVDGQHVVLLLEKDCELVAQHVEPRSSFEEVAERDIWVVVIGDGELLFGQRVPERPGCL